MEFQAEEFGRCIKCMDVSGSKTRYNEQIGT